MHKINILKYFCNGFLHESTKLFNTLIKSKIYYSTTLILDKLKISRTEIQNFKN